MAILYSSGFVVVDSDPNGIAELQGSQKQLKAIKSDGTQEWKYVTGNAPGSKWTTAVDTISKVEIPLTAFADDYNPLVSEVITWVSTNLTAEQKENSLLYSLSPIPTRPLIYTYPTTSSTLYRNGADRASLTSIIINGTTYPIGLNLETAAFLPLEYTELTALETAIKAAFTSAGHTVGLVTQFTQVAGPISLYTRFRVIQLTGSTPFTVQYVYVDNSVTATTALQTNTPTVASSQTLNTDTINKPNFVWSITNNSITELFRFKPTDTKSVETTVLPTFSAANHTNGLVVKDTTHDNVYISDGTAWQKIYSWFPIIDTKMVNSSAYQGADRPETNIYYEYRLLNPTANSNLFYIKVLINITPEIISLDLSDYFGDIEIDGNRYEIRNLELYDSNEFGHAVYETYRSLNTSGNIGFTVAKPTNGSGSMSILLHLYDYTNTLIATKSNVLLLNKSDDIILDELIETQHNTRFRNYTTTQRNSVTLNNTTDIGKCIYNTTNAIVEYWTGTTWMNVLDKRVYLINPPVTQPTFNVSKYDIFHFYEWDQNINQLADNMSGLSLLKDGKIIEFIFQDDGSPINIQWGGQFVSTTIALPVITVANTKLRVMLQYHSDTGNLYCVGVV